MLESNGNKLDWLSFAQRHSAMPNKKVVDFDGEDGGQRLQSDDTGGADVIVVSWIGSCTSASSGFLGQVVDLAF
jgi:hypothetical protein